MINSYKSITSILSQIRNALKLMWESSPAWSITSLALTLLLGVLPLASIYIIKIMVDTIMATPQPDHSNLSQIIFILAAAGIIFFLNAALQPIANAIKSHQASLVSDHVYAKIHLTASILDFEYFENPALSQPVSSGPD